MAVLVSASEYLRLTGDRPSFVDAIDRVRERLAVDSLGFGDEEAASWHASERARLAKRGRPPTASDGQIAAIARVNELVVVTANVKDFRRFEGLEVENWFR